MCKILAILKNGSWAFFALFIFIVSLVFIWNYSSTSVFPSNFPIDSITSLKEKDANFNFSCSLVGVENRNYAIVGDRIDCAISYNGLTETNIGHPIIDSGLISPTSVKKFWDYHRWEEYANSILGSNFESLDKEGMYAVYLWVQFGNETVNIGKTFSVYSISTSSNAENTRYQLLVAGLALSFSIFVALKNLRDLFQKKGGKA